MMQKSACKVQIVKLLTLRRFNDDATDLNDVLQSTKFNSLPKSGRSLTPSKIMPASTSIKAIVCDVNGTMFSLDPIGKRMQQVGLDKSDLEVCKCRVASIH